MRRSGLLVLIAVVAAVGAVLLRPVAEQWRAAGESSAAAGGPVLRLTGPSAVTGAVTGPVTGAGTGAWTGLGTVRERAVGVLHDWDRRRSEAYAEGDVAALRRLYVPGSAAGRADVRLLQRYLARGYVVTGMRMQLLAVAVLAEGRDRLRLRVTDRLRDAVAVAGTERARLPRDAASDRILILRRAAGGWRVAAVRDAASRG